MEERKVLLDGRPPNNPDHLVADWVEPLDFQGKHTQTRMNNLRPDDDGYAGHDENDGSDDEPLLSRLAVISTGQSR
jgi:hypothetical protein